MWRMGLLYLDRGDSALFSAFKKDAGHNNTRQLPGSPQFSPQSDGDSILEFKARRDAVSPTRQPQQWMTPADATTRRFSLRPEPEDPLDSLSPMSDTTLFEEPGVHSPDQPSSPRPLQDLSSLDDSERPSTALSQRRGMYHHRRPSNESIFSIAGSQKVLEPIRARAKTNEGLLQLQMSTEAPKTPRPVSSLTKHGRRISLGLPISSVNKETEGRQRPTLSARYTEPNRRKSMLPKTPTIATLAQEERDLEYKHRHTFIGTASLDEFLEILEISPQHTTTRSAIAKAFILLTSNEHTLARQASTKPAGWELVSRIGPDVSVDYVASSHIRLGSVSLRQFLDLIYFDEHEECNIMMLVEAFSACSHLDANAGAGTGSKARAVRSWMVRQQ